jgi:hypothetical protein
LLAFLSTNDHTSSSSNTSSHRASASVVSSGGSVSPQASSLGHGAPRDAQEAFDTAQTDPLQHRTLHLGTHLSRVTPVGAQGAIAITRFAVVFLGTFVIMPIFDQIFAAALRTRMRYNRLYHEKVLQMNLAVCPGLPFHASSVNSSPLPQIK